MHALLRRAQSLPCQAIPGTGGFSTNFHAAQQHFSSCHCALPDLALPRAADSAAAASERVLRAMWASP